MIAEKLFAAHQDIAGRTTKRLTRKFYRHYRSNDYHDIRNAALWGLWQGCLLWAGRPRDCPVDSFLAVCARNAAVERIRELYGRCKDSGTGEFVAKTLSKHRTVLFSGLHHGDNKRPYQLADRRQSRPGADLETADLLEFCLKAVPEKHRRVVMMSLQGYSHSKIAGETPYGITWVRVLLSRYMPRVAKRVLEGRL